MENVELILDFHDELYESSIESTGMWSSSEFRSL